MTMNNEPPRWVRRFDNYTRAFIQLEKGVKLAEERELSDIEKEGVIQRFEYTQELAWNVIRDFYKEQGETGIQGSRDAFRMAFERGLVTQGSALMKTIKSRNATSHTYDENTADEIFTDIVDLYYSAFLELKQVFEQQIQLRQST